VKSPNGPGTGPSTEDRGRRQAASRLDGATLTHDPPDASVKCADSMPRECSAPRRPTTTYTRTPASGEARSSRGDAFTAAGGPRRRSAPPKRWRCRRPMPTAPHPALARVVERGAAVHAYARGFARTRGAREGSRRDRQEFPAGRPCPGRPTAENGSSGPACEGLHAARNRDVIAVRRRRWPSHRSGGVTASQDPAGAFRHRLGGSSRPRSGPSRQCLWLFTCRQVAEGLPGPQPSLRSALVAVGMCQPRATKPEPRSSTVVNNVPRSAGSPGLRYRAVEREKTGVSAVPGRSCPPRHPLGPAAPLGEAQD